MRLSVNLMLAAASLSNHSAQITERNWSRRRESNSNAGLEGRYAPRRHLLEKPFGFVFRFTPHRLHAPGLRVRSVFGRERSLLGLPPACAEGQAGSELF